MLSLLRFSRFLALFSFFLVYPLFGRESFEFTVGEKINIISDKAYRKSKDDVFEAVGNVIITQGNKALYGEKGTIALQTGEIEVVGNVRYVTPGLTMYGSRLQHNSKTDYISIYNARIISEDYVIFGKNLSKLSDGRFYGEDAEYTTCRDCPESWSIFGKRVFITPGEYITVHHGSFKINGVVVMYIPYIIFPIKKKRQTGLLFPHFGFGVENNIGVKYQQPWFWAIGPHNDMTLTPSIFGKRGWGNELEYRHVFGDGKWMEFSSLHAMDRIYEDNKKDFTESGHHYFRHFSEYEHQFMLGYNWNHHFYFNEAEETDILRDFSTFVESRIQGTEMGLNTFIDGRSQLFNFGIESYYNRNIITSDPKEFDHHYVQVLPKFTLGMAPVTLLHTQYPLLRNISFGFDADYTVFKQNHFYEQKYIRNANRINVRPYLDWFLARLGPLSLKTNVEYHHQDYSFPYETSPSRPADFKKQSLVYESEVAFEVERIYGLAYNEKIIDKNPHKFWEELDKDKDKEDGTESDSANLIGDIPQYEMGIAKKGDEIRHNSYRHTQQIKLKHYFLSDSKTEGNERFAAQILEDNGMFDQWDAIRDKKHELSHIEFITSLPMNNTIELQWNNSVIKKTSRDFDIFEDGRSLRQNFDYSKVAYLNVSQGYDLNVQADEFQDALTRLFVDTGVSFSTWGLRLTDYYFYQIQKHVLSLGVNKSFGRGNLSVGYSYNSLAEPLERTIVFKGDLSPSDIIKFTAFYDYDLATDKSNYEKFDILYSPRNNCWKLNLSYKRSLIEREYSIDILINYNKNNFISLF